MVVPGSTATRTVALGAVLLLLAVLAGCGGADPAARPTPKGVTAPEQSLTDLAYATASPAQKLDLLLPARTGTAIPVVIAIHGGAWQLGDKRDMEFLVQPLRAAGYAVASINYRLTGEAPFPAAVLDAKAALRWLRAHAAEYGIDPGSVGVWGSSAGGNLAALLGLTGGSTASAKPLFDDPALGNPNQPTGVQAVVDFYGPADLLSMDQQFATDGHCTGTPQNHDALDSAESAWLGAQLPTVPDRARQASPVHYLGTATGIPPFFLAHGLDDCVVPDRQSTELAEGLRAKGVRAELTIVPGFGHADGQFDREQTPSAVTFLTSVLGRPTG